MKLLFKLIFGTALLLVIVIATITFTLVYIDPNDYKDSITNKVKAETGRDLNIEGDIKLSYYPWLGLDVAGISVGNADGFGDKPFLKTDTVTARVKLLPLFRKELEMDTLVLHGATVHLAKNAEGVTNWDDLIKPQDKQETSSEAMPLAALVLGGIDIKDANLYWNDKQQGVEYKLTDANISTGELKFGEPIELAASLNVSASKPALSAAISFNGTVAYEDSGDVLLLKPMLLEADVKGKQIPGGQTVVKLSSEISVDVDKETAQLAALDLIAFNTEVKGQINASEILSGKPELAGEMDIKGEDLAQLLKIIEIEPLASQVAKMKDRSFDISTAFNADSNRNDVDINKLTINLLGNNVDTEIYARNLGSDSPAAKGSVKAKGPDFPALIKIASQFIADESEDIKSLSSKLASASKPFNIETQFDVDLKRGVADVPALLIQALGMTAEGKLNAKNMNSKSPVYSGHLKASGSDLPLLMQIAGSLQGSKSELTNNLGKLKQKAFDVETQIDADMASGKIDVPALNVNAFGFKVSGNFKGNNIQKSNGSMTGKLVVNSQAPKSLLTALGQADIAKVLKSININTDINGNTQKLSLKPFSLEGVFSGKNIPNSPVTLNVKADSDINLEKEIFNLSGLQISGLGLDVKGNIKATQFKTAPALSGQIAVAPFDLRQFMKAMNKPVPKTSDANVLKRVAISSAFSGTPTSLSLKDLKAELDETKLQGDINIKQISPLDVEFGLGVDKLNADNYLPPKTKAKPVTPEAVAVSAATGLPVETLQAIKIKGDFVMGSLFIANATLSDMELSIRADKGDIKLAPAKAKLYQGTYLGDIHLDATGKLPKLTMKTDLKGVEAEPLLTDVVGSANAKGTANISLALASSGADINTLRNTLSGKGDILFETGTLIGVDVKSVLHQVELMIESKQFGTPSAGEKTEFEKLTATLDIHNGIIDNHDLLMLGSGFNVTGKGMLLNLGDETWKYTLTAKADATRVSQGEKTFNIGGHEVPITCKGKIADKNCKPDVGAIASTIVKKAVVDKLFEGLGVKKKSSVPAPAETTQQTESAPANEAQPEQIPVDPVDELINQGAKKLFDKLF